jgi:hypothetical protein
MRNHQRLIQSVYTQLMASGQRPEIDRIQDERLIKVQVEHNRRRTRIVGQT